jgi:hypothetical protein
MIASVSRFGEIRTVVLDFKYFQNRNEPSFRRGFKHGGSDFSYETPKSVFSNQLPIRSSIT